MCGTMGHSDSTTGANAANAALREPTVGDRVGVAAVSLCRWQVHEVYPQRPLRSEHEFPFREWTLLAAHAMLRVLDDGHLRRLAAAKSDPWRPEPSDQETP